MTLYSKKLKKNIRLQNIKDGRSRIYNPFSWGRGMCKLHLLKIDKITPQIYYSQLEEKVASYQFDLFEKDLYSRLEKNKILFIR